jgi:hypothetical protein
MLQAPHLVSQLLLSEKILLLDSSDWHEQYLSLAILKAYVVLEFIPSSSDSDNLKNELNPDLLPKKKDEVFKSTKHRKVVSLPVRTSDSKTEFFEMMTEKTEIDNDRLNDKKNGSILMLTLCRSGAVKTLCALLTHNKSCIRDLAVEVFTCICIYT